jgi:hypothetical protein
MNYRWMLAQHAVGREGKWLIGWECGSLKGPCILVPPFYFMDFFEQREMN